MTNSRAISDTAPVAVLGAGSWGTALAILLARKGLHVRLWPRRPSLARLMAAQRRNPEYLSEFTLPEQVEPREALGEALAGAHLVVLAAPTKGMRWLLRLMRPILTDRQAALVAAKGLESRTGLRMSQVVAAELGSRWQRQVSVLSGPNLAVEVARGTPTSAVIACADSHLARQIQHVFMQPSFRVYTNPDLAGVELGGALKNVIAIGAGISDGLGFGDNTKAAYLTRGLAEMTRLGAALGANPATFGGLSGLGDLVATCAGPSSRNHYVGKELAGGRSLKSILSEMRQIAEGVPSARAALRLAVRAGVDAPITEAICSVLFEGLDPRKAVASLMTRAGKDELHESWLVYG